MTLICPNLNPNPRPNLKPIIIIGAGLAGSIIAYRLLQQGNYVRIFDQGSKKNRVNQQIPWGWYRRISLQCTAKLKTTNFNLDHIPFVDKIKLTKGPMLISTQSSATVNGWKNWLKNNPYSDAKILLSLDAEKIFNIPKDYLGQGGLFVCDSRDMLIDFRELNYNLWDYLKNNKQCEFVENAQLEQIIYDKNNTKNRITHLLFNGGTMVEIDKAIIAIGNQTPNIFKECAPTINLKLPYAYVKYKNQPKQQYISLWNRNSTINRFLDGTVKIACGNQSIVDIKNLTTSFKHLPYFMTSFLNGYSNIHYNKNKSELIKNALDELKLFGYIEHVEPNEIVIKECTIDLTPTLCPNIFFLQNLLIINGFSGSGSILLEPWIIQSLINSLNKLELDEQLKDFNPNPSLLYNLYPPPNKITGISALK